MGVNRFGTRDTGLEAQDSTFHLDPTFERRQIARLRSLRAGRSEGDWKDALAAVDRAARDGSNLVPPIIMAVEKHATLGEIADSLRRAFGEYQDASTA